jgi:hypothetical protein
MASIQRGLLICVLYKGNAKSSDFLILNMFWMSDELMGEGNIIAVLFGTKE